MAGVPEAEIERLKQRVSLASLVEARGIELRRVGKDLVGCCLNPPGVSGGSDQ